RESADAPGPNEGGGLGAVGRGDPPAGGVARGHPDGPPGAEVRKDRFGVHAMRQTALSASPTSTIGSGGSRRKSPTRSVRNVTESGTVAFRGSGEPLASDGCVAVPAFASRERSVISSAMRGKRSTKPAAVTCAFASSLTSDHIVW